MSKPLVRTIADFAVDAPPLIVEALHALADVDDRGVHHEDSFESWRTHLHQAAAYIGALRDLLSSDGQPGDSPAHVGVLLGNVPAYLRLLTAAACSELVVVGLNSTRRGAALGRDARLADCRIVLTDADHEHLLSDTGLSPALPVLRIDSPEWAELVDRHQGAALPISDSVPVGADDLVVLVFTSGTSGDPKAVRVTQRKISVPGLMLADRFDLGPQDCVYSAMPLFHSNAILVAWPITAFAGCSIALRTRFSASAWLADVRRYGCTFANYVGTPLSYVLATDEQPDDAENPLRIMYGNEASASHRREFERRFGCRVIDGFGSTEGGVSVSRTPDTPDAALGRLSPGTQILHPETGLPCPPATFDAAGRLINAEECTGELVSDGAGLFAGYWRDPEADAERMRDGRFHSGDLAYLDTSGFVHFAGRSSGWMRIDGENLTTAPIERILARHPLISEVAVYALPAPDGVGDRAAAAIVPRPRVDPDALVDGLVDFLSAQADLGPKQWPSVLRLCSLLPRTASFKVRSRDLAALALDVGPRSAAGLEADRVWIREGRGAGARFRPLG